jgi:hypothetical protein
LRDAWVKEYNAFVAIESSDYIVKYLGSFEQNNRCFMILEYASEGSLLELFKRNERPATEEERRYFLYGLMGLTKAIDKIQNLGGGPRNQRTGLYVTLPILLIVTNVVVLTGISSLPTFWYSLVDMGGTRLVSK